MSGMDRDQVVGSLVLVGQIGFLMVACILIGFLLGWYLDRRLGTGALFTIVLLLAGIAAGMWTCYKTVMRGISKDKPGDRDGGLP